MQDYVTIASAPYQAECAWWQVLRISVRWGIEVEMVEHVMRSLAVETKGKYSVVTGEPHLRQVLADYAPPPPSLEKETPSSLVQMGFPNFVGGAGDVSGQGGFAELAEELAA